MSKKIKKNTKTSLYKTILKSTRNTAAFGNKLLMVKSENHRSLGHKSMPIYNLGTMFTSRNKPKASAEVVRLRSLVSP